MTHFGFLQARFIALVLCFPLAFYSCSSPEPVPQIDDPEIASDFAALNSLLHHLYQQEEFNGVAMIARNGKPQYEGLFGVEDASGKDTLTTHSMFRLASVSKAFTAAGILRLCAMGKLELDTPVASYFPCFHFPEVTARHLLNHNSGVPDIYMDVAEEDPEKWGSELSIQEVVQIMCETKHEVIQSPLEEHSYNNTGYVLLAGLIEEVSGMSFEDFLRTELFEPLGMEETRVWNLLSAEDDFPNKVTGFRWSKVQGRRQVLPSYIDGVAGDGAVFCSLHDFLIWDAFWNGNELIPDAILKEAFVDPVLNNGEKTGYGFGWGLGSGQEHAHGGAWLMALTYIYRNPETGMLAVVLSNNAPDEFSQVVEEVESVLKRNQDD